MMIANDLVRFMSAATDIADIAVAPPGFINFTLKPTWLAGQVNSILALGDKVGNSNIGQGSSIQLEFVSANPTGPLHVGNGRGAILGSALASAFSAAGYRVEQEYYVNDAGNQVQTFYRSLWVRYQQELNVDAILASDGYQGAYVVELAKEIVAQEGDRFLKMTEPEALKELGSIGLHKMLTQIKESWTCWESILTSGSANKNFMIVDFTRT